MTGKLFTGLNMPMELNSLRNLLLVIWSPLMIGRLQGPGLAKTSLM